MRRLVGLAVVGLATLAPTWAHADDEQIAQEIIQKLEAKKDAGLLKGFGIDLEVENGTVILKGVVATTDQRNLALDIARRVPGVEKVVNGLALKTAEQSPLKAAAKLPEAPAKLPEMTAKSMEVITTPQEVDDEAVSVPEFKPITPRPIEQRSAAAMPISAPTFEAPSIEARPMSPPSKMKSRTPSPAQTAAETPEKVQPERAARQKNPDQPGFISSLSRTFALAFGDATEEATPAKSPIRQVAHNDPELTQQPVKKAAANVPVTPVDDEQIANQFRKALLQEKQTGNLVGFHVDAKSTNGKLWVSGHVANYDQHMLVIEKARRIRGVKQVVNDLKVTSPLERIASTHERNDPSTPLPEGTGVANRGVRSAPYVEAVPVPVADPSMSNRGSSARTPHGNEQYGTASRTSGTMPQDPAAGNQQGMRVVPMPVQFVPVQMGMPQQYGAMPYGGMPPQYGMMPPQYGGMPQTPLAFAPSQGGRAVQAQGMAPVGNQGAPMPTAMPTPGGGIAAARYDHPNMPGYAWPSYAAYPNYAAVTYPKQYSPSAWPYIGPFYPYPQVPLGWRKVSLEWDDGWWMLDFKDKH